MTVNHFFGAPTGAMEFFETINRGFNAKKVQPPMLMGKAKVPSELSCVLNHSKM